MLGLKLIHRSQKGPWNENSWFIVFSGCGAIINKELGVEYLIQLIQIYKNEKKCPQTLNVLVTLLLCYKISEVTAIIPQPAMNRLVTHISSGTNFCFRYIAPYADCTFVWLVKYSSSFKSLKYTDSKNSWKSDRKNRLTF